MPLLILKHADGDTSSVEVGDATTVSVSTPILGGRGETVSHDVRTFSLEGVKSIELASTPGDKKAAAPVAEAAPEPEAKVPAPAASKPAAKAKAK